MKQSGIDWIGEIPDDWKIEKFGHVLKERNEKNNPIISTERLSVSIDIGVTLYSDKTTNLDRFKDDFSQYFDDHYPYKYSFNFSSLEQIYISLLFSCHSTICIDIFTE